MHRLWLRHSLGWSLPHGLAADADGGRRGLIGLYRGQQWPTLPGFLHFVLAHQFLIKLGARSELFEQPGDVVGLTHTQPRSLRSCMDQS